MENALVRGAVAEEGDRDLPAAADARREAGAGGERDAAADDRVRAEHPAREVRDVHRAAAALAEAVLAAVDLGHHRPEVAALGDAVAVAAVGARDVVVVVEVGADARRDRLLADVHVHEARDLTGAELARDPLLEEPDREHRPVEAEQRLRGDRHRVSLLVVTTGAPAEPATSASKVARNAAAGPPSTARWSNVRHACIVGRTAIAPSPTTTGRSRMRPIQRIPI